MPRLIFIHRGWSECLYYAIRQARRFNPDIRIDLLGDHSNQILKKYVDHFLYYDDFSQEAHTFAACYKHNNLNPDDYVLFILQRWFILKTYLRERKIERCFYSDSDVMYFCDLNREAEKYAAFDYALCFNPRFYGSSAHCSLWNSSRPLIDFCDFVMRMYRGDDKQGYEELLRYGESYRRQVGGGGVDDMTAFYSFARESNYTVGNLDDVRENSAFNFGKRRRAGEGVELYACDNFMNIIWEGNLPSGRIDNSHQIYRINAIHCQGPDKAGLMKSLFKKSRKPREYVPELFISSQDFIFKFFLKLRRKWGLAFSVFNRKAARE